MRSLLLLLPLIILAGCARVEINQMASIDPQNKSITLPPGGAGITGSLKKALTKAGWKTYVYQGPSVIEGTTGRQTSLRNYDTFHSRYSLFIQEEFYDWAPNFDRMYHFDISLVDNKNGQEVLTATGSHAGKVVVNRVMQALQN